ncbi:MAG: proline dehydrogenase family protein, partial [Acidimicrobiales bacterium]
MAVDTARQREIADFARRLAGYAGQRRARVFALSWWTDHLLSRAMADPAFRARLFRFVDVFPALASPPEVVDHLRSEFEGLAVPWWMRSGLGLDRVPGGAALVASVARRQVDRMARQFIVGTGPAEVARAVGRMWAEGSAATVDLLGEHTHSDAEAQRYAARLTALVEHLGTAAPGWSERPLLEHDGDEAAPRASVSVKVTALSPSFAALTADSGLDDAERLLLPILERARDLGVGVWFDMERYDVKDLTHRLFRRLLERPELDTLHAGIVVQAYLRDAPQDLASVALWAQGRRVRPGVRLVKGAYWDTETIEAATLGWQAPVHVHKYETDVAFEEMAQQLHQHHRVLKGAFASHNLRSIAAVVVDGRRAGLSETAYEVQLLYGMAEPVHDAVRAAGLRLRVYTPMGELVPGMAYLVRRLLENTSNDSFVRHAFADGEDIDALVAAPSGTSGPSGTSAGDHPDSRRRRRGRGDVHGPVGSDGATGPEALAGDYHPEPPAQWHRPEVVAAFEAMIEREFSAPARQVDAVVGGRALGRGGEIVSVDPADPDSVVALATATNAEQVAQAVDLAAKAAPSWS